MQIIPFLYTIDVHDRPNLNSEIATCLDTLAHYSVRATFFIPALLGAGLHKAGQIDRLLKEGHQLACHGLYHDSREDYMEDSLGSQIENLHRAKELLEDVCGYSITSFRAPAFRVSANTYCALDQLGFRTDLSVCSQRLGLLSSQIGNYEWLVAPRTPYHPSSRSPYRKGELGLLSIPFTSCLLPFMSNVYHTVGLTAAMFFARVLLLEATLVSKPIVFMSHPEEFVPYTTMRPRGGIRLTDFVPGRTYGFPIRWFFYQRDEFRIYSNNLRFAEFLTHRRFEFLTVDQYVYQYHFAEWLKLI